MTETHAMVGAALLSELSQLSARVEQAHFLVNDVHLINTLNIAADYPCGQRYATVITQDQTITVKNTCSANG